jgi:hypothetical protein
VWADGIMSGPTSGPSVTPYVLCSDGTTLMQDPNACPVPPPPTN